MRLFTPRPVEALSGGTVTSRDGTSVDLTVTIPPGPGDWAPLSLEIGVR